MTKKLLIMVLAVIFIGTGTSYAEELLGNGGFEAIDSEGFPTSWDGSGKNLVRNGNFESTDSWTVGNNSAELSYEWDAERNGNVGKLMWNPNGTFNANQWNSFQQRDDKNGVIPIELEREYNVKMSVRYTGTLGADIIMQAITNISSTNVSLLKADAPSSKWTNYEGSAKITTEQLGAADGTQTANITIFRAGRTNCSRNTDYMSTLPTVWVDDVVFGKTGGADRNVKRTGDASLRIDGYTDGMIETWQSEKIDINGGAKIEVSGYAMAEDTEGRAFIGIVFYDTFGNELYQEKTAVIDSSSWNKYTLTSEAALTADSCRIVLGLESGGGKVWFDDVSADLIYAGYNNETMKYISWFQNNYESLIKSADMHEKAAIAARYYKYFGDETYLNDALNYYSTMFDTLSGLSSDFFSGNYVGEIALFVKEQGLMSDTEEQALLSYFNNFYKPYMQSHNQVMARALGMEYALKIFPDAEAASDWKNWLDRYWDFIYSDRDMQEDAGDYNAIALRDFIRWAELSGRRELLLDDDIRKLFERFREQTAPNGSMPEYGDDFYGRTLDWIYIFEYCASLYDDPGFAYAARTAFDWGIKNAPSGQCMTTETLELLDNLYEGEGVLFNTKAMISYRLLHNGRSVFDKILLRSTKEKGNPYVMIDNGHFLSHSHTSAGGGIIYLENEGVPLFHSFTRRYSDIRYKNKPALLPENEEFPMQNIVGGPMNPGRAATGVWYNDSMKLTDLPICDESNTNLRQIDSICLRFSQEKSSGILVTLDNIRLEGPKGTKMLFDFEDGQTGNWSGGQYTNVTDGYQSEHAMQVAVGSSIFYTAQTNIEFDIKEYDTLKWDWKTATAQNDDMTWLWFIMRLTDNNCLTQYIENANDEGNGSCYIESQPGEIRNNDSNILDVLVENKEKNSYTEFVLDNYYSTNSTLKRRIVLTEDAVLAVQDTIYPSEEMIGYQTGPLWGMYNISESGDNWFLQKGEKFWYEGFDDSTGKTNGAFVLFSDKGQLSKFGSVHPTNDSYITYGKTTIKTTDPVSFLYVVVPNVNDVKTGAEIAKGVSVIRDETLSGKVRVGGTIIEFLPDGSWNVVESVRISKEMTSDSIMNVKASMNNNSGNVIVAYYENDCLLSVSISDDNNYDAVTDTINMQIDFGKAYDEQNKKIRVFVWENTTNMKPVSAIE